MEIWNIERNEKWYESKWHGYSWEWDQMKPTNPRLQWMAILCSQGVYNFHIHSSPYLQDEELQFTPVSSTKTSWLAW